MTPDDLTLGADLAAKADSGPWYFHYEEGMELVHSGLCPACMVQGVETVLTRERPTDQHYHDDGQHQYLFCAVDGQGYRIENDELRILVPCNGGLHPWDVNPRESPRFA